MAKKRKSVMIDVSPSPKYLPQEVVNENILTRLPAHELARFASVSKLWYHSIFKDSRFAEFHFGNNRNRRNLNFNLFNVNDDVNDDDDDDVDDVSNTISNYFFRLQKDDSNRFYDFKLFSAFGLNCKVELIGNSNGLTCVKRSDGLNRVIVHNPNKRETLTLTYFAPEIGGEGGSLKYLCHGFGFDSLSQEYKVVLIYRTKTAAGERGFICMVGTLGVRSWRSIVSSTSEMSPPPGSYPLYTSRPVTRIREDINKSATNCGGDLFWRITNSRYDGEEIKMLLSFDIHTEKIQFIGLPRKPVIMMGDRIEDGLQEIAQHLLEYKGYPCVARSKKILIDERIHPSSDKYRFCYYQFKIQMHILKDKFKPTWTEVENFDVRLKEDGAYFNKTEHSNNHREHPTRMFSFSDQVMLYWFDGGCLKFYNLQTKHHYVVKGTRSYNERIQQIFEANCDVLECPCTDYQLHAQVENIISLRTFVPEGAKVHEYNSSKEFQQFVEDQHPPIGWVNTGRESAKGYVFF